jgi:hypothetical protein
MASPLKTWTVRALVIALTALSTVASTAPSVPQSTREGPIWYMAYTRAFPGKVDDYVEQMRLFLIPILEEDKRQGGLLDYKVLRKSDPHGPEDWNVALALIFQSYAKMDGYRARWDVIAKQLPPDKNHPEVDRDKMRLDLGKEFLQEVEFK